jgi:hypothetical protein
VGADPTFNVFWPMLAMTTLPVVSCGALGAGWCDGHADAFASRRALIP